jgi:cation diffusion facilitator family transporter
LSLIADGFDSVFDSASNVIGLIGIYIASRPADQEHPYGHRKFETLTAVSISLLLFLTTLELFRSAGERLRSPELITPTVNAFSFGALLVSITVHVSVVLYELRAGRKLKSDVLVADAMHTKADIYISLSVIGGLIAVRLGFPIVDPLLAIAIAILIAKIGIDIIRESSKTLLDQAAVPPSEIERIVMGVRDVQACHDIRSRGHEDAIYVDLHIKVAPEMSTAQSHAIAHDVQHRLKSEIPTIQDVVVHVEPEDMPGREADFLIPALRALAEELNVAIHDITAHQSDGVYHVQAHVTVDGSLSLTEAHAIASRLEHLAQTRIDRLGEIVTHIEPNGEEVRARASRIVDELNRFPACHDIQVYPVGDNWAISMHCLLNRDWTLSEAHAFSGEVEKRLRDSIPRLDQVVIHTEPLAMAGESPS